jgi:hypothetical protein
MKSSILFQIRKISSENSRKWHSRYQKSNYDQGREIYQNKDRGWNKEKPLVAHIIVKYETNMLSTIRLRER